MRIRFTCRRYFGNNIFAKIMAGAFIPIVFCQQLVEEIWKEEDAL